jgi:L-iditol 2-dehydrogenase
MKGLAKLAPGPGHMAIIDRDEPVAGAGHVVLDVLVTGICGTDLHIQAGEYPSVPPVTVGHEVCGRVAALGPGVDEAWAGERVVVETYFSTCGRCAMCRAGRGNMCAQRRSIGTHVDGGFAPGLVLPAANLHRVPAWLDDAAASLSEPLACVCNALLDPAVIGAGDHVLVIGPGAIGLVAAQVARACGGRVTVRGIARDAPRLALAAELGFATEVAGADDPAPDADGPGAPAVVIECSGSGPGVAHALAVLRRRGTLVQMGLRGADLTVPWDLICYHELAIRTGFASTPTSWRRAMALLDDQKIALAPLVTEVVALEDWAAAFDASRGGDGVKYVLDPRGLAQPTAR